MMNNPFLQRPFPVSPSMNQVRIIDLPGLAVPEWVRGKSGLELLSSFALRQRIVAEAKTLQLDPNDARLLEKFDSCLTADSPQIRTTAQKIVAEYGRSLAYLLLTLKRGDAVNQQARADWRPVHWAFWQQIETVWLGGGLLSGSLGQTAVPLARQLIQQNGFPAFRLALAPNGRHLPLLGMARTAAPGTKAMLLFDFGQTAVKRAVADYENDCLTRLTLLPTLPAPCLNVRPPSQNLDDIVQFANWLMDLLAVTWRETAESHLDLSSTVAVSLACYLLDGQPRPEDVGCYGRLQHLTSSLNQFLTDGFSQRLGQSAPVNLWHDGAAASLTWAGETQTAVFTFGTAIGVGFPPLTGSFCALDPALIIRPAV
jgi:hypothetical protein